jgi:predicted O-methyltransferase YrrM
MVRTISYLSGKSLERSTKGKVTRFNSTRRLLSDFLYVLLTVTAVKFAELTCRNLNDFFRITRAWIPGLVGPLLSAQHQREIVTLLGSDKRPRISAACEIGTGTGGTTYLLMRVSEPDAILITVDLNNDFRRALLLTCLKRAKQRICVIAGDSQDPATFNRIVRVLGGRSLDLLLIDGDHSHVGVKCDFETYSQLVRDSGWIAFHDIVPDYRTRYGVAASGYAGDVPRYWREVRGRWPSSEIIEDPSQDGYGIGVLHWRPRAKNNSGSRLQFS